MREEERLDVLAGFESREAIELPIHEEQIRRKKVCHHMVNVQQHFSISTEKDR